MSDRKLFWLTWYMRATLLFGIFGLLYGVYVSIFVDPDIVQSYATIMVALLLGILFFSTFPWYRINIRFNKIKKNLLERTDFDKALLTEASKKNDIRSLINSIGFFFSIAVMILGFVLVWMAYYTSDNLKVFIYTIVIIAASFVFNALSLMYRIDDTFNKLEKLIFQDKHKI